MREIAERSDLSPGTVQPIFRDDWNPTLNTLVKLEAAFLEKKNG